MRTPLEIISELKTVTYWSQPNIKFPETMALLNELEYVLSSSEETTQDSSDIEEPKTESSAKETTPPAKKTTAKRK